MRNITSIVTVTYNSRLQLLETIESVKLQKNKGALIEFIVIDGNSTDGTKDVINDNELIIDYHISEPDRGIYDAMNKGLKMATGDSILFLNSGDVFTDTFDLGNFQKKYNLAQDCIFCRTIQVFGSDAYLRPKYGKKTYKSNEFGHQGVFAPKHLYKKHNFNLKYPIAADQFWMQTLWSEGRVQIVDDICSIFSLGGLSNSPSIKQLKFSLSQPGRYKKKTFTLIKFIISLFLNKRLYYRCLYSLKYERIKINT